MNPMDGAVILDKPAGITSFGAVRRVRSLIGGGKVGHVGTLDPLGTGVLPMLVGRATRLARFYLGHEREYVAGIRFGWATTTYDRDGEAVREPVDVELERPLLEELFETYRGTLSQTPPQVSAKKVDGVRAYKLARKRRPVRLDPVSVEIRELELLEVDGSLAVVRCLCSAGTYIRSLAHDLGQEMGCGAHVASLRRTLVGEFSLENAHTLESLESMREAGRIEEAVLSPARSPAGNPGTSGQRRRGCPHTPWPRLPDQSVFVLQRRKDGQGRRAGQPPSLFGQGAGSAHVSPVRGLRLGAGRRFPRRPPEEISR